MSNYAKVQLPVRNCSVLQRVTRVIMFSIKDNTSFSFINNYGYSRYSFKNVNFLGKNQIFSMVTRWLPVAIKHSQALLHKNLVRCIE